MLDIAKLLTLAAKAAGIRVQIIGQGATCTFWDISDPENHKLWRPHLDDGDSRRLQVACGIDTVHDPEGGRAYVGTRLFTEAGADRCLCVRWAVLRAAAFMGREMVAAEEAAARAEARI